MHPHLSGSVSQRRYQVELLHRIAGPVLEAGASNQLKERVPVLGNGRDSFAPLEALGRTLCGIAPWLELGPGEDKEGRLRARCIEQACASVASAVDPRSPGYLPFGQGGQTLVDTAFLAHAFLRAPKELWGRLNEETKEHAVAALKATRTIQPPECNWLLFSALVEAAIFEFTGEGRWEPIEKAVARHLDWYKGDGAYGDGPFFHWDFYNSFVIHPMLLEVIALCERLGREPGRHLQAVRERARRYSGVLERMISPEGAFPVMGRSATYRIGAFHNLSLSILQHEWPEHTTPGGLRAALHAVIMRMMTAPNTFDQHGWLTIGVVGGQPGQGEAYINRGSVYLCTAGLLQLGLPEEDPFWQDPDEPWTQKRIWSGQDLPRDHAMEN